MRKVGVTHHPFASWVTDSLGETGKKTFLEDVALSADAFDPGGSVSLTEGVDSPVLTRPRLIFKRRVWSAAASEWTIEGLRYEQDGESRTYISPFSMMSVTTVNLKNRKG